MRVRRTVSMGIAAAMTLAVGVFASAAPNDDSGCDPGNGKYICDGTDDQPEGAGPTSRGKLPEPPSTGVSHLAYDG